jgi:hypothetical protein
MRIIIANACALGLYLCGVTYLPAQEDDQAIAKSPVASPASALPKYADPAGMKEYKRLDEKHQVWIDPEKKTVLLGAVVCCREGVLEMFACPAGTKEYESVLAVQSPAYVVHAALLAVGAKPGTPVKFMPEYQAATGQIIDVFVSWSKDGVPQRVRGQEMVQELQSKEVMQHDWVFGGSGFWKDEDTGEEYYHAEGGELICVSNFSTAMMDLAVESSQQNSNLLFGTFTEHIPELGTQVVIELIPRIEQAEGRE